MGIKEEYLKKQKASGIKVGDRVRVLRKAKEGERGWGNSWVEDMDGKVGKTGIVHYVDEEFGIGLSGSTCGFPYFVLEKVKKTKKK